MIRPLRAHSVVGLVLAGLLSASRPAPAQQPGSGRDPALAGRVRQALQKFVDEKDVSGVVAVVGDKEGVVCLEALGTRDLASGDAMKPESLFRIASMTKPITALGVLILADEGKLAIDDPVEKHLPEFRGQMLVASRDGETITLKKPPRPITLRDLLTHTSGLPGAYPPGLADLYAKRDRTLAEATLAISQRPLEFEPGSKWAYCNPGIDTLGRVIEVVSGRPYEAFLKERIFDPLGMTATAFYPDEAALKALAVTYDKKDGALTPAGSPLIGRPLGAKHPVPAGGLYATGPDLAKLYRMLLNGGESAGRRIVSAKNLAEMTKLQTGDLKAGFTDGTGFGLGVGLVKTPTGVTASLSPGSYGHGGAFGTQGWIDPAKGRFVVLLIQRVGLPNADASDVRRALQEAALGGIGRMIDRGWSYEDEVGRTSDKGGPREEEVFYSEHPAMFRNRPVGFVLALLLVPLVVGVLILLAWYLKVAGTTLTVTDRRVSLREGIFSRHTNDVFHNDIRNVRVNQTLFQRIFGTGDVGVSSSGQSDIEIRVTGLPDPQRVKAIIDRYR